MNYRNVNPLSFAPKKASKRIFHLSYAPSLTAKLASFITTLVSRETKAAETHICAEMASLLEQWAPQPTQDSELKHASDYWEQYLQKVFQEMLSIGFTRRQAQVVIGMLCQRTYSEIGHHLRITERTIRTHTKAIFEKIGCTRKSDLAQALHEAINQYYQLETA